MSWRDTPTSSSKHSMAWELLIFFGMSNLPFVSETWDSNHARQNLTFGCGIMVTSMSTLPYTWLALLQLPMTQKLSLTYCKTHIELNFKGMDPISFHLEYNFVRERRWDHVHATRKYIKKLLSSCWLHGQLASAWYTGYAVTFLDCTCYSVTY